MKTIRAFLVLAALCALGSATAHAQDFSYAGLLQEKISESGSGFVCRFNVSKGMDHAEMFFSHGDVFHDCRASNENIVCAPGFNGVVAKDTREVVLWRQTAYFQKTLGLGRQFWPLSGDQTFLIVQKFRVGVPEGTLSIRTVARKDLAQSIVPPDKIDFECDLTYKTKITFRDLLSTK